MNRVNMRYLLVGLLVGALSMRSGTVLFALDRTTLELISSLDDAIQAPIVCTDAKTRSDSVATETSRLVMTTQLPPSIASNEGTQWQDMVKRNAHLKTMHDFSLEDVLGSDNSGNRSTVEDFVHQPGVVIVLKIHGEEFIPEVKQSLCLLQSAYNNRVLYDIVLFATIPLPDDGVTLLRRIVHPAKLIVQYDEKTLQEQIADMTPAQQEHLLNRCADVNSTADIRWKTRCKDGKSLMPIAYCWMSEFRSKQIWTQQVLKPYKYMLWYDSDNFATEIWKQDPIAFMIRENLALLMANYAQGTSSFGSGVQTKIFEVYNKTLCDGKILYTGRMLAKYGGENECRTGVKQVHGFFHITNLDFYRLPINLRWSDVQIGDNKFSRQWDDQLAVAVPPSMLAPDRAMEMEKAGLNLEVMHNSMMMGKRQRKGGGFKKYWRTDLAEKFPEARERCSRFVKVSA